MNPRRIAAGLAVSVTLVAGWGVGAGAAIAGAAVPQATPADGCPVTPLASALPTARKLEEMNAFLGRLGARPTGSPQQNRYIHWIQQRVAAIPGVHSHELVYRIRRWSQRSAVLRVTIDGRSQILPVADAVPYSHATGSRGVTGDAVLIPDDTPITALNAHDKVIVRPAPAGSLPDSVLVAPSLTWSTYDPQHTLGPSGTFTGDWLNYNARVTDLRAAATAGAKGILFVKDLPRSQIAGHYEPYEGTQWGVPGMFLGADQGQVITAALAAGQTVTAQIVERATVTTVSTPSIEATLAGRSPRRIVIDSHTDGTNALEDNGPVAMVAMLRYFARLPPRCRPRTLQFAFSTAHFYQDLVAGQGRQGGAGRLAARLDSDYNRGTVSVVLTLEQLGARDFATVPRPDGQPGDELEPDGLRAVQFIDITPSRALVAAVNTVVHQYELRRTILARGAGLPGSTVPAFCSFGGEGTPYNMHLLPTIGVDGAPETLYDPAFELDSIDFHVMHAELLAYTELVSRLGAMSQSAVAGQIPKERRERAAGAKRCAVRA